MMFSIRFAVSLVLSLVFSLTLATSVFAQLLATDPDWKESDAPAPTALNLKNLVPFDVSGTSNLTWALDAAAVTVLGDGLVRYIVIARSQSGVLNALYEVINCGSGEVKTYARIVAKENEATTKTWTIVDNPKWKSVYDIPSKHALVLAKQGVCTGNSAAQNVSEILASLKKTTIVFKNKAAP